MRAHVGDVWLWLCRAACPGPGVHVWRRGLSPPTPNPSLCVVKETESGEARAALTIKGVSGLQSFRVQSSSFEPRRATPSAGAATREGPRRRATAAAARRSQCEGARLQLHRDNRAPVAARPHSRSGRRARAGGFGPPCAASDGHALRKPLGSQAQLPVAARSKASKLADGARRTRASLVFRGRLERRGRRGHSRRGRRPEGTAGWVGGTVGGAGGGGEGVVARGEKKDAMPGVAFAAAAAPRRRFCRALASPLTFSSSGLPAISHG